MTRKPDISAELKEALESLFDMYIQLERATPYMPSPEKKEAKALLVKYGYLFQTKKHLRVLTS